MHNDVDTEQQDNKNMITPQSLRVVFMGTPEFSVPSLMSLINASYQVVGVVTQPDKPQGRHMVLTPPPVKTFAIHHGIPVFQPEKMKDQEFLRQLNDLSLDLIVTAAYGKILPVLILDLPKFGCINVHASLLPLYRGAAPVHWSIINGDSKTGITIMNMDKGMDTGAILRQKTVDIPFEMNTGELMEKLAITGAEILSDTILDYCNGRIMPVQQDDSKATMVKPITKEDGLIDWNNSMLSIYNKIRGCNPWPVAYSYFQGKRFKLYNARIPDEFSSFSQQEHNNVKPGSIIISENKANVSIVCSDGVLEIVELQIEGCKKMHARECAHNLQSYCL